MAAPNSRVYVVSMHEVSITTAKTLIQILAGATVPLQLIRATVGQTTSNTSTQLGIQINRKSAAATVTLFDPVKCGPSTDPAAAAVGSTSGTGHSASAEGTDTDILVQDVWNYTIGWSWIPGSEKDYKFVDAGGIVGLKYPDAPAGALVTTADLFFEELA